MNKKLIMIAIAIVLLIGLVGAISYIIYSENSGTVTVSGVKLNIPEGYTVKKEGKGYAALIKDDKHIVVYEIDAVADGLVEGLEKSGIIPTTNNPFQLLLLVIDAENAKFTQGISKKINNKEIFFYFEEGINNTDELTNIMLNGPSQ